METPALRGFALHVVMAALAAGSIALPAYVVTHPPRIPRHARIVVTPKRVVPQAELPPVEPVRFVDLNPEDARAFNAEVPFSTDPNPAARSFRFVGGADDLARATDCLATAVLYEAGDDTLGERAVAQVVINRLRHPAFPKTVCGVIFEGQERSTGCQFSFACDGAVRRWQPSEVAWKRARQVATAALSGAVFTPVGYATHYHTDWVVPYWQSSLDKVAAVHTHLFFRWTGWWGTPPAFNRTPQHGEPAIAQLAAISDAHRIGGALDEANDALAEAASVIGAQPEPVPSDANSFLVTLPRGAAPETYPALAAQACGARAYCKYSAWTDPAKTPTALPLEPQQIAAMTFSYLRDRAAGYEKPLWNCQQLKRPDPTQCMRVQVFFSVTPVMRPTPVAGAVTAVSRGPGELTGVRKRGEEARPAASIAAPKLPARALTMPGPAPSPTPAKSETQSQKP